MTRIALMVAEALVVGMFAYDAAFHAAGADIRATSVLIAAGFAFMLARDVKREVQPPTG